MIILVLSQATQIDTMSTPYKGKQDPDSFYGLSTVLFSGTFDDLDSSHYTTTIGTQTCEILSLSQTELECLIPPWDSSDGTNAGLRVEHNGSEIYSKSLNHGNAYPIITFNRNEASAGDISNVYRLWSGSDQIQSGSVENEAFVIDLYWSWWVFDAAKVQLGSNVHGDSNPKFEIDGIGQADMLWTGASYTLQGEEYFFRTIACVDSISHNQGDALGGLERTITGQSFPSDTSRIRVEIDGSDCEVTSASFSSITCITGPYYKTTLDSYYEGSAGLFSQRYDHGTSNLQKEQYIPNSSLDYDLTRKDSKMYGYFKAPRTGEYTFYASVNDKAKVWLSTDADPLNKQQIISALPYSYPFMHFDDSSPSSEIQLLKDQLYYLEVDQENCCGQGFFSLGVKIPGDGNSYRNRMPLVKRISITSLHSANPIEYKGTAKEIGELNCGHAQRNYFQKQIGSKYFNLYTYCLKSYLYVIVPSYMNPQPEDLKFRDTSNNILDGELLHQPSDSQFWFVIPSDFLRTYQAKPQLRVWIDNRLTMCRGDCSFEYHNVPVIKAFSESSALVTITGDNLPTDISKLELKLSSNECRILSASDSSIQCQLDSYTEGDYQPQITYEGTYTVPIDTSINYYISLTCSDNCNRCFLDECLECNFGYNLFEGGCIFCAEGTYFESGSCLSCDPSCDECSGSGSSNCDLCNFAENFEDDGSGNCVCKAGLFRDGAVCSPCSSNCAQCSGSPSQCTACTSPLVLDSSANRCSCKKGFTQINNTCECTDGVIREGVCTNFYSNLTCDKNNLLTLTFSEPVASSLTQESINIQLQNKSIEYTYSLQEINKTKYEIDLDFESYVAEGEVATLEFLSEVVSESGFELATKQLETTLWEYNPNKALFKAAKGAAQVTGAIGTGASAGALLTGNPAEMWSMLNNIQVLSYIVLSNNPLTPTLKGFFEGLDIFNTLKGYLYNLLGYEGDYGIRSNLFIVNAGIDILIILVILLSWPLVWVLSKIPCLEERCESLLREYKYNAFIRYWIQCYLDLSIACFIQVSSLPSASLVEISNLIVACFVLYWILVTPKEFFGFFRRTKDSIRSLPDDSGLYKTYGTLLYEFKCRSEGNARFTYMAFVVERLGLAASLALLGSYPYFQASANCGMVLVYTVFVLKVRPYKETKPQIVSIVAQLVVTLVYGLAIFFLDPGSFEYELEVTVMYSTMGLIFFQSSVSLLGVAYAVYSFFRKRSSVTPVVPVEEVNVTGNTSQVANRETSQEAPAEESPSYKPRRNYRNINEITVIRRSRRMSNQ